MDVVSYSPGPHTMATVSKTENTERKRLRAFRSSVLPRTVPEDNSKEGFNNDLKN